MIHTEDKENLIEKLFAKKEIIDYTYVTLFFLISTLFAFFAIRPSLIITFALRKESGDLKKIHNSYEQNIDKIIAIQSQLESVRSKIYLLEEATPSKPAIKIVIDNLQQVAIDSEINLKKLTIPDIVLKSDIKNTELKNIPLSLSLESEYKTLHALINNFFLKRRLTVIKNLQLNKNDPELNASAELKYTIDIENYYL